MAAQEAGSSVVMVLIVPHVDATDNLTDQGVALLQIIKILSRIKNKLAGKNIFSIFFSYSHFEYIPVRR